MSNGKKFGLGLLIGAFLAVIIILIVLISNGEINYLLYVRKYKKDNIIYELHLDTKEAYVTISPNASGEIVIPSRISKNKNSYKVVGVGRDAFKNNSSVYKVTLSEGLRVIESGAFDNDYIIEIIVPNTLEVCDSIFSEGIKTISQDGLRYLGNIDNPYVLLIGEDKNSEMPVNLQLPEGVKVVTNKNKIVKLGSLHYSVGLFYGVKELTLPDSLVSLDCNSFFGVDFKTSLETLNISSECELKNLQRNLYLGKCDKLKYLYIPKNLVDLHKEFSQGLNSLEQIEVHPENKKYSSYEDSNVIVEKESKKLLLGCANSIVPDDIQAIADYAFAYKNIQTIVIPPTVTEIGEYAFKDCTNLQELIIPKSVNNMGYGALQGCLNIQKLVLPFIGKSLNEEKESNLTLSYMFGKINDKGNETLVEIPNAKIYIDAKNPITLVNQSLYVDASEVYLLSNIKEIKEGAIYYLVDNLYLSKNIKMISGPIFFKETGTYSKPTHILTNVYCEAEEIIPGWITTWNNSEGQITWEYTLEGIIDNLY